MARPGEWQADTDKTLVVAIESLDYLGMLMGHFNPALAWTVLPAKLTPKTGKRRQRSVALATYFALNGGVHDKRPPGDCLLYVTDRRELRMKLAVAQFDRMGVHMGGSEVQVEQGCVFSLVTGGMSNESATTHRKLRCIVSAGCRT